MPRDTGTNGLPSWSIDLWCRPVAVSAARERSLTRSASEGERSTSLRFGEECRGSVRPRLRFGLVLLILFGPAVTFAEPPDLPLGRVLLAGLESEEELPLVTHAHAETTVGLFEKPEIVDDDAFVDEPADDQTDSDRIQPPVIRRPFELVFPETDPQAEPLLEPRELLTLPMDAPLGYTGRTGVLPSEPQSSSHFVPMEDRWRMGFPEWDRYGKEYPPEDDYPFMQGRIWDPYNQNVLKGDYPIIGQHTFLTLTATNLTILETR